MRPTRNVISDICYFVTQDLEGAHACYVRRPKRKYQAKKKMTLPLQLHCDYAMPFVILTQMNDQQYKPDVGNYLGLSVGPVNLGSLRCQCWTLLSDPDHPQTCVHLGGANIGRHDTYKSAWYRGMQHAGMSVSKQPKNQHLQCRDTHLYQGPRDTATGETSLEFNKNGGAGHHLRSYNRDGREDSGGAQGGRQECQDPRSAEEKKHHG